MTDYRNEAIILITVRINDEKITTQEGLTILEIARQAGRYIPTLCHMDMHNAYQENRNGTCRVCMVEVEGSKTLVPACSTEAKDGMIIKTNTQRAVKSRRTIVELLLSNHPGNCITCDKNLKCELQRLASEMGIREIRYKGKIGHFEKDESSRSISRNPEKCVLCRRCETMCTQVQSVGVFAMVSRGFNTTMGTAFDEPLIQTDCTFCGQCVTVCPTGALSLVDNHREVWRALRRREKHVIVQVAPSLRVTLGEEFDLPEGTLVTGSMTAAIRRLGFDGVYDTCFAADLTVMEEATELLERLRANQNLPLLTSCCPAWVHFVETQYPDLLPLVSTCRSPHEMFGSLAKTYLAQKMNMKKEDIFVVSVMPCLAKKFEISNPAAKSKSNVDYVLSTRELSNMLKEAGIAMPRLPDEPFDSLMGVSSGSGLIFGVAGGVMEAIIRTLSVWTTGKSQLTENIRLRGSGSIREASVSLGGQELHVAAVNGLGAARKLLDYIREGKCHYDAIEVMACPGGCIGGSGQPECYDTDILKKRADSLFLEDKQSSIRLSHENPEVKSLYREFLKRPMGDLSMELLHVNRQ